jgi:hypothetical protein
LGASRNVTHHRGHREHRGEGIKMLFFSVLSVFSVVEKILTDINDSGFKYRFRCEAGQGKG